MSPDFATLYALAMDFIDKSPTDPDITNEQAAAWVRLQQFREDQCRCNMRARFVGYGCMVCNPELHLWHKTCTACGVLGCDCDITDERCEG